LETPTEVIGDFSIANCQFAVFFQPVLNDDFFESAIGNRKSAMTFRCSNSTLQFSSLIGPIRVYLWRFS
jgi:hypothetical protein